MTMLLTPMALQTFASKTLQPQDPSFGNPRLGSGTLPPWLLLGGLLASLACSMPNALAGDAPQNNNASSHALPSVNQVMSHIHVCSDSLVLRTQNFTPQQEQSTCRTLAAVESRFHQLFGNNGSAAAPVAHDGNRQLRANIYASRAEFEKYAGSHFGMPVDNGGMYLEGLPERAGNQAEFVANQKKDGQVHNLEHEFTHYLDGRYNLYGDFCANLHDSHGAPENCPKPAPQTPYLVWWTEGVAEYLAHGQHYPEALTLAHGDKRFALSELFDTGYESNNGVARTYPWGYLAVRYMLEQQRPKVDQMLGFTRSGDYPRYQALLRSWGKSMDADFAGWLAQLPAAAAAPKTAALPVPAHS